MSIYQRFGIAPIINAAGTLTRLGGTVMRPEVRDAMSDAVSELVPIDELQAAASDVIAQTCGCEAGFVTSGASAGLTLATAACLAGLDLPTMDRLPRVDGGRSEVIMFRTHRNSYDHAYRAAGATLVEVGMSDRASGVGVREGEPWELAAAITERTAAIAYTASPDAQPSLAAVSAVAHQRGIPVIVDAAGQLPPPSNLRRFIAEGADLVSFSGGKALRGPQGTGVLAGRRDLIASVALQQLDMDVTFDLWEPPPRLIPKERLPGAPRHGVGRGYKVSKEQIVGLMVALQLYDETQARADAARWMQWLGTMQRGLSECRGIRTVIVPPRYELGFPLLEIHLDSRAGTVGAHELIRRMRDGSPRIFLGERKVIDGAAIIHPMNLDEASVAIVLQRLLAVLNGG